MGEREHRPNRKAIPIGTDLSLDMLLLNQLLFSQFEHIIEEISQIL